MQIISNKNMHIKYVKKQRIQHTTTKHCKINVMLVIISKATRHVTREKRMFEILFNIFFFSQQLNRTFH